MSGKNARELGRSIYAAYAAGEIAMETVQKMMGALRESDWSAYREVWREFCLRYTGREQMTGSEVAVAGPVRGQVEEIPVQRVLG